MKLILEEGNKFVLRFDSGEEVIAELREFCKKEQIVSGSFSAIGAVKETEVAFYDLANKHYRQKKLLEDLEIVSLSGNIALLDSEIVIHAHGSFADSRMTVRGGHVMKLVVSATCEVVLEKLAGKMQRQPDQETGLNLLN